MSVSDLISRWKTIVDFAAEVGCGYEAARQMRRRGSIAPEHWPKVVEVSVEKGIQGVTYEWLATLRAGQSQNTGSVSDKKGGEREMLV